MPASSIIKSLIIVLSYIGLVNSVPVLQFDGGKAYRQHTGVPPISGLNALTQVYDKYKWTIPPAFTDALQNVESEIVEQKNTIVQPSSNSATAQPAAKSGQHGSSVGEVTGTLSNSGAEYLCPVIIGGQTLYMNVDTGSSDLWVFNYHTPQNQRGSHNIYEPRKSPSYTYVHDSTFSLSYGDQSGVSGEVASDTVIVAGITVPYQSVSLPDKFSDAIVKDPADGIMGLGFQKMNSICTRGSTGSTTGCPAGYVANPQPTWFENAVKYLEAGLFTVNYKQGTVGYINFGSIDGTAYKGDLAYTPVDNSQGYWQISLSTYKVGAGAKKDISGYAALADTGTSLIMLSPDMAAAYYSNVLGAQNVSNKYFFPCKTSLPDFTLTVGAATITIPGAAINFSPSPSDPGLCYGGIQPYSDSGPIVLGDLFFKYQFVVFDYDNTRLGLAQHA